VQQNISLGVCEIGHGALKIYLWRKARPGVDPCSVRSWTTWTRRVLNSSASAGERDGGRPNWEGFVAARPPLFLWTGQLSLVCFRARARARTQDDHQRHQHRRGHQEVNLAEHSCVDARRCGYSMRVILCLDNFIELSIVDVLFLLYTNFIANNIYLITISKDKSWSIYWRIATVPFLIHLISFSFSVNLDLHVKL